MNGKFAPTEEPTLEEVSRQFDVWRKSSKLHEPIPAELWKAAASLCGTYRAYKIARRLRLNYTKLKEHVHALKPKLPIEKAPAATAFIELDFNTPAMVSQCVIEMQDPNGGKIALQLKGDKCPDPIDILKAFWSRKS
jgi:hypothetical protein